jgi:hypothetical protein
MNESSPQRFLVQQGLLIFLAGLLMGAFTQAVANPRMMMAAHTGTLMMGTFVLALAPAWQYLSISEGLERLTMRLLIGGAWVVSGALVFAAVFETSRTTPLLGAGYAGAAWAEAAVDVAFVVSSLALLVAAVFLVRAAYSNADD